MNREKTAGQKVAEMLLAANGGFVTGAEIENALRSGPRTGGRLVWQARRARPDLEIINVLGQGYRIANLKIGGGAAPAVVPVVPVVVVPVPPVATAPMLDPRLPPSLAALKTALDGGKGQFVGGARLARACGVPMPFLINMVRSLRSALPDAIIEGKRGHGYRIVIPGESHDITAPVPRFRDAAIPMHVRKAKTMAALDLIPAKSAEIIKVIALESNETGEETLNRLIAYGCEVHRDLVACGANPVGLRAIVKQDARS